MTTGTFSGQHETSFSPPANTTLPNTTETLPLDTTHAILYPNTELPPQTVDDDLYYDIFNDPAFDASWFNIDPEEAYRSSAASCGFIPTVPNIVDEVDRMDVLQSTEAITSPASGLGFYSDKYVLMSSHLITIETAFQVEEARSIAWILSLTQAV